MAKTIFKVRTQYAARYAARAKSHKVVVPGASHVVYISHPKEVAALIEEAARDTSSNK